MTIFLFTDIEGSTQLWEKHTTDMGAAIARHDALLRERVSACGGQITKYTGDGVTAAFVGGDPVRCALELQLHLAREPWGVIGQLLVRAGLHAGAAEWIAGAEAHEGDFFGPTVNCTARIMSAAWGGQILLSPEVVHRSSLPDGSTLLDLGKHLLKDVSAPQQIYQLLHPDLQRQDFPPLRTLSGQSILNAVQEQGAQIVQLDAVGMLTTFVCALLLPVLRDGLAPKSEALSDSLAVLQNLGSETLADLLGEFVRSRPSRDRGELEQQLEAELRRRWQQGGAAALALRADTSRLLRAVGGADLILSAARGEVREALAGFLTDLGVQFGEFRWMLGEVQQTLAEVRELQERQLDLQRLQLERTERLLERQEEQAGTKASAPSAEPVHVNHNLPVQLTSFVGREHEIDDVKRLLVTVRLVTLSGTGGTGKTRLALQVARGLVDHYEAGVFFVELASIRDPGLVAPTIAGTLDLPQIGGSPPLALLKGYLRARHMLLVLDNFEQVIRAAPLVGDLLNSAPRLDVLVTSRELLRIYGEQGYAVPPLPIPKPRQLSSAEQFAQVDAVQLFVQRAQAVNVGFTLSERNRPAVAEICARLEGLPLALELAAARVRHLPVGKILGQLDSRLGFLSGGPRDLPARQRTLRATVEWSYHLLSATEQRLFRRLAVFSGGCTLEAAETICNLSGDLDVWGGIEGLIDKSLLQLSEVAGEPRYGMLETLHEYAVERLMESGAVERLRRRHACFFLALAEAAEAHFFGREQALWLSRLELEQDNLRAALAWSIAREIDTALRIAGALGSFWRMRAYHSEGREWLAKALVESEGRGPDLDLLRAKALAEAGSLAGFQGDWAKAHALHHDSLALWQRLGDQAGLARALSDLGSAEYALGNAAEGRSHLEESIALYRCLGDRDGLCRALFWQGHQAWGERDYERALLSAEESRQLAEEIGSVTYFAAPTTTLGRIAFGRGDYAAAESFFKQSLRLMRESRDMQGVAIVLYTLGSVSYILAKYEQAWECLTECLEAWRNVGDQETVAGILHHLGFVALRQARWDRARNAFAESLALHHQHQDRSGIALCLVGLAGLAEAQGHGGQAARLLGAAHPAWEVDAADLAFFRADHDRILAGVRGQLDEPTFRAGWQAGAARGHNVVAVELLADSAA